MMRLIKPSDSDLTKLIKDFKMKSIIDFKKDLKSKGETLLVLKEGDKLLGVIKYKIYDDYVRIESFYIIDKQSRGKGFGTLIYSEFEKKLIGKKYVESYVYQTNPQAIIFWQKNGFKMIKEDRDAKGEKMYYMKKEL